jgi:hypothetical protein
LSSRETLGDKLAGRDRQAADDEGRGASCRTIPQGFEDEVLVEALEDIQQSTREIMREFNIASSGICAMARAAEESITDTALRATFLRLIIDLHEFGREAGRRGLLPRRRAKVAAKPVDLDDALFHLVDRRPADAALGMVSLAFFDSLEEPAKRAE